VRASALPHEHGKQKNENVGFDRHIARARGQVVSLRRWHQIARAIQKNVSDDTCPRDMLSTPPARTTAP